MDYDRIRVADQAASWPALIVQRSRAQPCRPLACLFSPRGTLPSPSLCGQLAVKPSGRPVRGWLSLRLITARLPADSNLSNCTTQTLRLDTLHSAPFDINLPLIIIRPNCGGPNTARAPTHPGSQAAPLYQLRPQEVRRTKTPRAENADLRVCAGPCSQPIASPNAVMTAAFHHCQRNCWTFSHVSSGFKEHAGITGLN